MLSLKPTHKPIRTYLAAINRSADGEAVFMPARLAFKQLLEGAAREIGCELAIVPNGQLDDHALLNRYKIPMGNVQFSSMPEDFTAQLVNANWRMEAENALLFTPFWAVCIQKGEVASEANLRDAQSLTELVHTFLSYTPAIAVEWQALVDEHAQPLKKAHRHFQGMIRQNRMQNQICAIRFRRLKLVCRQMLFAGFGVKDMEWMIVQHLLATPLIEALVQGMRFNEHNAVATEMEEVIQSIPNDALNREYWKNQLQGFYEGAIKVYRHLPVTWGQGFLEAAYRIFFHTRDDDKFVYNPLPEAVQMFIVQSVNHLLHQYFGRTLSDPDLHVLDPFSGMGNLGVQLLRFLPAKLRQEKYLHHLHGNERKLLPYYLATMNIEREYQKQTGESLSFPGMCLVDTFGLGTVLQTSFLNPANAERVEVQRRIPMHVIWGSPPSHPEEEDTGRPQDNLKELERKITESYDLTKPDMEGWVRALRWATDRVAEEGVIAFFMPSGFFHKRRFEALRKQLLAEFTAIYVLEIGDYGWAGQGEASLVFLVMDRQKNVDQPATLYYKALPEFSDLGEVLQYFDQVKDAQEVDWEALRPAKPEQWPTQGLRKEFTAYLPLYATETAPFGLFTAHFSSPSVKQLGRVLPTAEPRRMRFRPFSSELSPPDTISLKLIRRYFPTTQHEKENRMLVIGLGEDRSFYATQSNAVTLNWGKNQTCLPLFVYGEDGVPVENISDEAVAVFRQYYHDNSIHKWAIFHYVYAVLMHADYRSRFAVNLQWEMPHIPFLPNFWSLVDLGKTLGGLHLFAEDLQPHRIKTPSGLEPIQSVRLSRDKTSLVVNRSEHIACIPAGATLFRIGERSAIEWVIESYAARIAEKAYQIQPLSIQHLHFQQFLHLLGQVINVSLETIRLIDSLLSFEPEKMGGAEVWVSI